MASTSKRKREFCHVCCESFTIRDRKPVECASCAFVACAQCHEKYLESTDSPKCMQCGQAWSRDFLDSQFKKVWLHGAYTQHRQDVLLEHEIAQLPASQHLVRNYRTAQDLQQEIERGQERRQVLWQEMERINRDRWNLENRIDRIVQSRYQEDGSAAAQDQPPYRFVSACPVEGCKGFLDSVDYKCGICNAEACDKCFVIKHADTEHMCNPEDVQTASLLKKDTKPCPSCASMIHKTDGCDQMWCTQCHTAFSWRTGLRVRPGTRIHNPEYFRYLRDQSTTGQIRREPGDTGDCHNARLPPQNLWNLLIRRLGGDKSQSESMYRIYHTLWYVQDVQLNPRNRRLAQYDNQDNSDLRLQYLLGRLTQDQWKAELAKRENRAEMTETLRTIYQTALDAGKDRLLDFYYNSADKRPPLETFIREVAQIFKHANVHLENTRRRFKLSRTYMLPIPFYLPK